MKLPNKYGNISKLPGKRRNPWRVRKTTGWLTDEASGKVKQQYITVGYYASQPEAIQALAEYNADPYNMGRDITFADVFSKWSREKFDTMSEPNMKLYKSSFGLCAGIHKMKFADIRKAHLQNAVDLSGKNYPMLSKLKTLLNQLYRYALENDICQKDYAKFVDIAKHRNRDKEAIHRPFAADEITTLWNNVDQNEYMQIILMLIYSGVRISEMLELKKCDVHIGDRYFDIVASKTEAGIRKVPIAKKTLPFFEEWLQRGESEYLIPMPKPKPGEKPKRKPRKVEKKYMEYNDYLNNYWHPNLEPLGLAHLPHDTRHTCISLLARANVNQTIVKRIVGHSGAMSLTEKVYTHFDIQQLIDAIDKI